MNYSNQYQEPISTVQLSPFAEEHWNRMVTYSPIYLHWTDLTTISPKRTPKPTSAKRNLGHSIDMNAIKFEDELLLDEIYHIRRTSMKSTLRQQNSYHEANFLEEEHDRRPTSPTDEYQRATDFFYQTREPLLVNQQYNIKLPSTQPQTNSTGLVKVLPNVNFGPKPQASLGVQLRQSTIARENARASSIDHRLISPLTMSSSRRPIGSAHSGRRANQQNRTSFSQTPQTMDTHAMGGLYEQISTDSSSTTKKFYPRSTNTSRSNMRMVQTKNDRARQKQHIELKTLLVRPCRQPISGDSNLEEAIPNSIEVMHQLGGHVSAFEKNLKYNYHRQLKQFRNGATKC